MPEFIRLQIGDMSENGQITIVDEDRLCYIVKSESRGASGLRTISKALLNEFVVYMKAHPETPTNDVRFKLSGLSDIDKYEYGYGATLVTMAKMILGQTEIVRVINSTDKIVLFAPCIESKEGINGFLDRTIPIVLEKDADLYKLNKFANVDGGIYLTIGKHNLGRASDKDARPNDINLNIEWTCGLNGKRYYLNREVNYPNFVTFQEAFNEAYKGIFEIVIDTIDYNGTQRKRYSLYAVNSVKPSFTPNQPQQSTKYIDIITAAKTKPFILLAGISGTGKSRIVRELARACWDEGTDEYNAQKPQNFEMIQVKPNWHDSTELMGYVSRVSGKPVYIIGDFLRFVVKAWENIDVPHFLCLDEMNLAPVEQYFAEYLSVIESRKLRDGRVMTDAILKKCSEQWFFDLTMELTEDDDLRRQFNDEGIALPPNLIVVGTVNMDETTFSFSRKVLDRAMTIEMNEVDLWGGLDNKYERIGKLSGDMLIGTAVEGVDVYAANKEVCDMALNYLKAVNEVLEGTPFKVAYRTRNEFLLYVVNNLPYTIGEDGTEYSKENVIATALDEITSMKILSRIEGDDTKVPKTLLTNLKQCIEKGLSDITGDEDKIESVSLAKLDEMLNRLESGYTSFWS